MQVWTWVCGHRGDRLRKPFGHRRRRSDVFDAAVLQLVHDAQPDFAPSVCSIHRPRFPWFRRADSKGDVDGFVAHHAFVAHLDPDGVEEHQRIERLQRPVLPFGDLLEDSVRDRTDEISGDVDPIEIAQWPWISRTLMPRAYIETIFSSKPGIAADIWRSVADRRSTRRAELQARSWRSR